MKGDIAPFVSTFKPLVLQAAKQVQHDQTCFAAIGILGDLCRQLQENVLPYCDEFMEHLLTALTVC
jgi:importin subunit beta-1